MTPNQIVSRPAQAFIAAVVSAGTAVLIHSLYQLYVSPPGLSWLLLAGLAVLSGLFTIKVPSIPATISVSETFVFTSVLIFGTPTATVTVALEALIMSSWRHRREFHKVLFNATEPTLSIWIASTLFFQLVGVPVGSTSAPDIPSLIGPMGVLCVTYFLLNSWLTATAVGLATNSSVASVWNRHFWWLCLNYFVAASVALIIVQNSTTIGITTLGIILPILFISYLTMKAAMGRLQDAEKHVAETERLYMSTVESLAMAIDAKDQVTHGHIRRVQSLAVGLAKALGLQEPALLKAIAASALLHDMGKLAVPEYILNKPGKLTATEFERMKLHSSVGAAILSSIDFPYPVVPIVRHHHENWDGSGYPDGLSGANIPIGARILSVVDCFDALTSDRPYRRKLPDAEALSILSERRGSMYDPLVVDAFLDVYLQIRSAEQPPAQQYAYNAISLSTHAHSNEKATLSPLTRDSAPAALRIDRQLDVIYEGALALQMFKKHLARIFPGSTCAIYALDPTREQLNVVAATGSHKDRVVQAVIPVGSGVSGWVAANRQPAFNADPALDFGTNGIRIFKYCLSSPIVTADERLIGVVTVYSDAEPFTSEHLESVREAISVGLLVIPLASRKESILP